MGAERSSRDNSLLLPVGEGRQGPMSSLASESVQRYLLAKEAAYPPQKVQQEVRSKALSIA